MRGRFGSGSFQFRARSKAERRIGSFSRPEAEAEKGNFGLVKNKSASRLPAADRCPPSAGRAVLRTLGRGAPRRAPRTELVVAACLRDVCKFGCEGKALPQRARRSSAALRRRSAIGCLGLESGICEGSDVGFSAVPTRFEARAQSGGGVREDTQAGGGKFGSPAFLHREMESVRGVRERLSVAQTLPVLQSPFRCCCPLHLCRVGLLCCLSPARAISLSQKSPSCFSMAIHRSSSRDSFIPWLYQRVWKHPGEESMGRCSSAPFCPKRRDGG